MSVWEQRLMFQSFPCKTRLLLLVPVIIYQPINKLRCKNGVGVERRLFSMNKYLHQLVWQHVAAYESRWILEGKERSQLNHFKKIAALHLWMHWLVRLQWLGSKPGSVHCPKTFWYTKCRGQGSSPYRIQGSLTFQSVDNNTTSWATAAPRLRPRTDYKLKKLIFHTNSCSFPLQISVYRDIVGNKKKRVVTPLSGKCSKFNFSIILHQPWSISTFINGVSY